MQMVMTPDETQIQIFANGQCHMQNAWPGTIGKIQNIVSLRDKQTADRKTVPQENHGPNHVKNEQHIGSEKTYGPKNTEQQNIIMQRTANENAACLRRICKSINKRGLWRYIV